MAATAGFMKARVLAVLVMFFALTMTYERVIQRDGMWQMMFRKYKKRLIIGGNCIGESRMI
jgi:hypothetical protein